MSENERIKEASLVQHAETLLRDVAEKPERLEQALRLLSDFVKRQGDDDEAADPKEPMFMGKPDRWYETPTWKCPNGHVGRTFVKSETRGAVCIECMEPVRLVDPKTHETIEEWLERRGVRRCGRCAGVDGDVRGQSEGWRVVCRVVRSMGFDEWEFARFDAVSGTMIEAVPSFIRELARRAESAKADAGEVRVRLRQAAAWFREYEQLHEENAKNAASTIVIHRVVDWEKDAAVRNRERAEYCEGTGSVPVGA